MLTIIMYTEGILKCEERYSHIVRHAYPRLERSCSSHVHFPRRYWPFLHIRSYHVQAVPHNNQADVGRLHAHYHSIARVSFVDHNGQSCTTQRLWTRHMDRSL